MSHKYDVVIVGAGISGINAAYRVQDVLPNHTYKILEGRHELGGTWSLFKYPGVRSDSDLHTFGFAFNPWAKSNPIAEGHSIAEYVAETAAKFGIHRNIEYRHKVLSADWSSDAQHWRLEVDNDGHRKVYYAKFVVMGTGYYNYEKPLNAAIPGLDKFGGGRVHPQFWPEDLDYKNKKMVVVGSGATAITLLPALVKGGAKHVTMLQRSPSYIMSLPQPKPNDPLPFYQRWLPKSIALPIKKWLNYIVAWLLYLFCQQFPTTAANWLRSEAKKHLPKDFVMDRHFYPSYNPWDQRLCLCPDADFFKCFETGRAQIVTDTIRSVVEDGIELDSGEKLDADIIVTATGLDLQLCGNIALSVDKKPVHIPDHWLWRFTMLTGVPNMGVIIGYTNGSWTLGADASSRLLARLMALMRDNGYTAATPQISDKEMENPQGILNMNSTYITSKSTILPHAGNSGPWLPRTNYIKDTWNAKRADLRQGMKFDKVSS
ncbi:FAD dependent oxidoreductase [Massariosphaeria phaeospora]|uniref:FAD dependent oxidoreductase n=1 Tax=Massariosphaeria phaeospora TaxID=100035 RepID=A0A7C8M704_9PLEO|nr:FAD dependent oxidoreductase [Massariosphaeria phaeospora]